MLICTNCYYIALLPLIPTPILYTIAIDARDQLAARPTAAAVVALLIFPLYPLPLPLSVAVASWRAGRVVLPWLLCMSKM